MRVCVTGASGRAGRATVAELLAHGYEVVATDLAPPSAALGVPVLRADLTAHGQAVEVLAGVDAVVHLANIPAPGIHPPTATFMANTAMNYHVFSAAVQLGLSRVVWASSETTLGLPFGEAREPNQGHGGEAREPNQGHGSEAREPNQGRSDTPPRYAPVDEEHYPYPTTSYALSKVAAETVAEQLAGWSGIPFLALRFSNILGPAEYAGFPAVWPDPYARKWNLWGYIDERDAAAACRLALTAEVAGAASFIIAAADTVMTRPSAELLAEVFPDTPLTRAVDEHETLLSIERARQVLGFDPRHTWRDHVDPPAS